MLLPDSVEQYVGPEHPVRLVDAFVDGLDLRALDFRRSEPAATGRPPYHPGDLLKLYLWGYLNRVTSSRRLERECARNLELLWLLGRLRPDFKTLADFRRLNAEALPRVFREFTLLARELGLYGREVVAIDGTQLKASNHPARQAGAERLQAMIAGLESRIADCLPALEASEHDLLGEEPALAESVPGLGTKLAELRRRKEALQRSLAHAQQRGGKAPLTDPECQNLKKVGLGYNAQVAVDAKHHLLAVAEIVPEATDHHQLPCDRGRCQGSA